jgi:hypothetical protein
MKYSAAKLLNTISLISGHLPLHLNFTSNFTLSSLRYSLRLRLARYALVKPAEKEKQHEKHL